MHDLSGQTAVVTGAASGIGAGAAEAFAAAGMAVVIADIEFPAAEVVAKRLADRYGAATLAVGVDVADPSSVQALAERSWADFGDVHLLFNNAGVMPVGPLLQTSLDDWRWLVEVNLYGVLNGVSAFVPRMLERGIPARVVNTASMASFAPSSTVAAYAASKQAVLGVSESLRMELEGTPVRVSVVCPGAVDTEIAQSERNRHLRFGAPNGRVIPESPDTVKARAQLISPSQAGRVILDGIDRDEFWIFTHPTWARKIRTRFDEAANVADTTANRMDAGQLTLR
ncbi:MAG TPA: SDR family NAD(P)-dependent oxidoreductase [Mycobacteriales bacterium]|jgi:NAD(P)-dependent dehydrogenase (short-subunit alcohol dehydrogenase family)|nr:SDR family NAD(P)-dependent oxidoreductase [Mycobacteriales bacterium]